MSKIDFINNICYYCYENIGDVADGLRNANSYLANSWDEVATLCEQIDTKLQGIIESIVIELNKYIESTESGERDAINAANEANDVTNDLLSKLNDI